MSTFINPNFEGTSYRNMNEKITRIIAKPDVASYRDRAPVSPFAIRPPPHSHLRTPVAAGNKVG